jgi:hypothetical protein
MIVGVAAFALLAVARHGSGSAGPAPSTGTPTTALSTQIVQGGPTDSAYIVQVASETKLADAQRIAQKLLAMGWRRVGVLRSDRYRELRPGYWVPFVGPFPPTPQGSMEAEAAHHRLPGSLVRFLDA